MHAALQQFTGTMPSVGLGLQVARNQRLSSFPAHVSVVPQAMSSIKPRQVFIQGVTNDGKSFLPSDWAERLAGAMSCFRPGGVQGGIGAFIGYSPYCVPRLIDHVKCVIVSEELKGIEPMAWDFVMNFARDRRLFRRAALFLWKMPLSATESITL